MKKQPGKLFHSRFLLYAGVGAAGTVVHWSVYFLLSILAAKPLVLATTVGAVAGALLNYVLNFHLVFKSRQRHRLALAKFLSVSAILIVVNGFVVGALAAASSGGTGLFWPQIVATGVVLLLGYFLNSRWTF